MRGYYPIHHAIYCKSNSILLSLLKGGVNPSSLNKNGQTPLHLAYLRKDKEKIKLLLFFKSNENQKCTLMGLRPKDYEEIEREKICGPTSGSSGN